MLKKFEPPVPFMENQSSAASHRIDGMTCATGLCQAIIGLSAGTFINLTRHDYARVSKLKVEFKFSFNCPKAPIVSVVKIV